ncbi:MAG: proton-conducting transporter membrane subunit [Faecalibacterium sp.]
MNMNYLLIPILLPVVGGIAVLFTKTTITRRQVVSATLCLELIFTVLACNLRNSISLFQIAGMNFSLQNDALANLLSILFVAMFTLSCFFGFEYLHNHEQNQYYAFTLFTLAAMVGLCYSKNLFTFYLFYEAMTFLSFPLVLHERTKPSIQATIKYLGYSLFGAALVLFGFFVLANYTTTSFTAGGVVGVVPADKQGLLLLAAFAMLVGFGGKAGLMPLHDWLPTAHPEAPAPASALLSGVITKGGVLGIIRVSYYLFGTSFLTGTWVQYTMLSLALITVFSGSMLAYKEKILKKRLAYSTVSQVSYILFGLMLFNSIAFEGAILQIVFHSICKVCLFLCAGAFICKTGKTKVDELYGIGKQMPLVLFCFGFAGLSLVGIPPFAGFVSKWYLATGALDALPAYGWIGAMVLLLSAALTAGYLLSPLARGFFPGHDFEVDAKVFCGIYIKIPLLILAFALLFFGLVPSSLLTFAAGIARNLL